MRKFIPPKYHAVAVDDNEEVLDVDYFDTREKVEDFCMYCNQHFADFSKVYVFVALGYCYAERVKSKQA